jgi:hypothetical protein
MVIGLSGRGGVVADRLTPEVARHVGIISMEDQRLACRYVPCRGSTPRIEHRRAAKTRNFGYPSDHSQGTVSVSPVLAKYFLQPTVLSAVACVTGLTLGLAAGVGLAEDEIVEFSV